MPVKRTKNKRTGIPRGERNTTVREDVAEIISSTMRIVGGYLGRYRDETDKAHKRRKSI